MHYSHSSRGDVYLEVDPSGRPLGRLDQQDIDIVGNRIARSAAFMKTKQDARGRTLNNLFHMQMQKAKRYFDGVQQMLRDEAKFHRADNFSASLGTFQPRTLTQTLGTAFMEKRPPLSHREAYDVNTELMPGVSSFEQHRTYVTGEASIYRGGRAEDVGEIQLATAYLTLPVVYMVVKYSHNWLEEMRQQFTGVNRQIIKARGAIRALEELENKLTYQGSESLGMYGALTHPYVDQLDAALDWGDSSTTPEQISRALHSWANYAEEESGSTYQPDTMQISPKLLNYIANLKFGMGDRDTVLEQFRKANPHIRNILKVQEFNDAGPGGSQVIKFHRRGSGPADRSAELMQVMGSTPLPPDRTALQSTMYVVAAFGGLNQREVGDILIVNVPFTR
ncbi:MAG: major capsid family protein [Myxococcota bacterium]